ncbi:MAG: carboxymuconolactone decarboxylase family protein [Methanosarcinales archaeon]|nr:carboxymuconolactone decarboxylase family protein [Methanosarcinales archaeon]
MSEHKKIIKDIEDKLGFEPQILHTLGELDPDFLKTYRKCDKKMLSDGALPAKMKVLMALAVVASQRCESCTVAQMRSALNQGATKEEIMETMEVVFLTSGAPGVASCREALKLVK